MPSPPAPRLYRTLADSPTLLPRLCRPGRRQPVPLADAAQHLELLDLLADEEAMDAAAGVSGPLPDTPRALAAFGPAGAAEDGRAGYVGTGGHAAGDGGSHARRPRPRWQARWRSPGRNWLWGPFAVIGLGKLGGGEMGYGSDLDVLYVAEPGELAPAARLAEAAPSGSCTTIWRRQGFRYEMDARLRPDGRKGAAGAGYRFLPRAITPTRPRPGSGRRCSRARPVARRRDAGPRVRGPGRRRSSTARP